MILAIRPPAAADEPAWRHLWTGYLDFYGASLPEDVYRTTFGHLLDSGVDDYHGLLALADDEPVGLVHFILHRHGWRPEKVCYLQDLFVAPAARGSGAGRKLIEAVYAAADRLGTPHVYWLTEESNHTARRLYDRVGHLTPFIKYNRFAQ
jgi:GNAT superfamily N-acetyltransferase